MTQNRSLSAFGVAPTGSPGWKDALTTQVLNVPAVGAQVMLSQRLALSRMSTDVSVLRSSALQRLLIRLAC